MKKICCLLSAILLVLSSCNSKSEKNIKNEDEFAFASLERCSTKNGMIYSSSPSMYINFDTMETSVLCAEPNCLHQNNECAAILIGDSPVLYNDFFYYFVSTQNVEETGNGKREYKIKSKLCRVALDSSETEDIVTFTDCKPRDCDGWLIIDNVVWFTGDNMNPKEDEYGNISAANQGGEHYICSIDLDSKKYTNYGSIYDGDKQFEEASYTSSAQISGYFNSKIMIRYEFAESADTRGQDIRHRYTEIMFEFDSETKELKQSELPMPSYVDNDTYVYTDPDNLKTYIINNTEKSEYNIPFDTELYSIYADNKLFLPDYNIWYDLTDMTEHSMGEYDGFNVIPYNEKYILYSDNNFVKLTEEELLALDKEN